MVALRSVFFGGLRLSGLPFLVRHTLQRSRVTILMFHDPEPARTDLYLAALARRYNIISLETCLEALERGWTGLPRRALVITLDDGFARNRELLALFRKHAVRPAIFLCGGIVATRRRFWFTVAMSRTTKESLKRVSDEERLRELARLGFSETEEQAEPQALPAAAIAELRDAVDFGAHTMTHPILPRCDAGKARLEVENSKQELEERFGLRIRAFAYPNGDFTDRDEQFVRQAGFSCAVTTEAGFVGPRTNPFRLPRLGMNDAGSVSEAIVTASGLWSFLRSLLRPRAGESKRA